jgi:hypothetical protein
MIIELLNSRNSEQGRQPFPSLLRGGGRGGVNTLLSTIHHNNKIIALLPAYPTPTPPLRREGNAGALFTTTDVHRFWVQSSKFKIQNSKGSIEDVAGTVEDEG